ncbi:MAG: M48 family metalloprotease [Pleurocapsa minor HA4230-MV1]|jgi:predicted Zn-dependent protease|nr:M48 family metalloprotease [Pleurocapsa minor HA4230-MV1]
MINYHLSKRQTWFQLLLATSVITVSNISVSASQSLAIDITDVIKGTVQYVQIANISDEQEIEIGKQTNQQVLSQYQLYNNSQIQQYVSDLGQELVSASDSRDIPFNFQVVSSDEVNAFATPGGFVYVTTGLLKTAENRAQLASVMAHEIAHINEKHGVKALKQAVAAQGIAGAAGVETSQLAQIAYQLTLDLPQSRSFEYEADNSGLKILQQSGYPAQAFADFLAKLESSGNTPEFIRTHPTSENRIKAISQNTQISNSNKGQDPTEYSNNVLSLL